MSDSKDQPACPVDHKSREAWLSQAKSAQVQSQPQSMPPAHPPTTTDMQESCPVDHKAREIWMQQAQAASPSAAKLTHPAASPAQPPASSTAWRSWLPFSSPSRPSQASTPNQRASSLGIDREISTIPRSSVPGEAALPSNHEQETGADKKTGNWVYPSEKMFFEAMKRKGHDPKSTDMQTVVPIHNAVNEKAWAEIKDWEGPWTEGSSCDGPRLHSFSGLGSEKLSPKARFNILLGYQAPFDRHDWIVDRCGKEIEYVIDFYSGRNKTGGPQLSFYLDVRPKLNSWEGVKMRAMRGLGIM